MSSSRNGISWILECVLAKILGSRKWQKAGRRHFIGWSGMTGHYFLGMGRRWSWNRSNGSHYYVLSFGAVLRAIILQNH